MSTPADGTPNITTTETEWECADINSDRNHALHVETRDQNFTFTAGGNFDWGAHALTADQARSLVAWLTERLDRLEP